MFSRKCPVPRPRLIVCVFIAVDRTLSLEQLCSLMIVVQQLLSTHVKSTWKWPSLTVPLPIISKCTQHPFYWYALFSDDFHKRSLVPLQFWRSFYMIVDFLLVFEWLLASDVQLFPIEGWCGSRLAHLIIHKCHWISSGSMIGYCHPRCTDI